MAAVPDTTSSSWTSVDVPRIKADMELRSFRREANLSWDDFNYLWAEICHLLNSPAYDILLDGTMTGKSEYERRLWEMTGDLLASGIFGLQRPGTWRYGRHEDEPDIASIADYLRRLTEYAAQRIVGQEASSVPTKLASIEPTKVGGWLTNQPATQWESYAFVHRPATPPVNFPPAATNEPNSTFTIRSKAPTSSGNTTEVATRYSPSCSATSIATTLRPDEPTV